MDILVENIPDTELQPELERDVTTAPDEPVPAPAPAPAPKRRGRPPGVKNKPKIIEPSEPVFVEPEFVEPEVEEEELPPPKPKKARVTKPKQVPRHRDEQPRIQTPLHVAASMLEILRLEQAERQWRKGELYKSWVK